jgi:rod shape-determining protein MreD
MILPRAADQLLLPANPLFISFTLLVAFGLNLIPLGRNPAMPDLLALALVFWNVHQPRRVGVGLRLRTDDGRARRRRPRAARAGLYADELFCRHDPSPAAMVHGALAGGTDLPLFGSAHAVSFVVRMLAGGMLPGWELVLAPVFEALLWPVVTWVLLAPQRRPPDPDENRPL